jgi:hypothetical protein
MYKATFLLGHRPRLCGGLTTDPGFKGTLWDKHIKCHEFSVKDVSPINIQPDELYCEAEVSLVAGKYMEENLYGPASSLVDKSLIYPCTSNKCRLSCPCHRCRKKSNLCQNASHEKSPGAGCTECRDEYWEHLLFHLAEHTFCKYCTEVASFLPHKKFVVTSCRGNFPDSYLVTIDAWVVEHVLAYLKPKKTDSTSDFSCDKCDKCFTTENNLRRHEKEMHFGSKHTCTSCGCQFVRKYKLDIHMKAVHGVSYSLHQFRCEGCDSDFQDNFDLARHKKLSQTCDTCAEKFCTLRHLSDHKRVIHKAFSCHICSKSFKDGAKLRRHQKFINCKVCDEIFCNEQDIRKHTKEDHSSLKCSYCDKVMSNKKWLNEHIAKRTDKSCSLCMKMYCYTVDLNTHNLAQHMTEKCPECEGMVLEGNLMDHIERCKKE